MSEVIVVGGGAAGMMAAIAAADCGHQVTIIEKNEKLGKKLFITGKGRCNITNVSDVENHLNHVISNPKFMYSAFYSVHFMLRRQSVQPNSPGNGVKMQETI